MKSPVTLTEAELAAFSSHITYELEMLFACADVLTACFLYERAGQDLPNGLPQATVNAYLNSFVIHTRNLIDFLYLRNYFEPNKLGHELKTQVVVEDYVPWSKLKKALPPITDLLKDAKKRINTQAAHLSTDRLKFTGPDKEWKFNAIAIEIGEAFFSIRSLFPPQRVAQAFSEIISRPSAVIVGVELTTPVTPGMPLSGLCLRYKPKSEKEAKLTQLLVKPVAHTTGSIATP
jgi:hypothetical protein